MNPRDDVIISYSNLAADTSLSAQQCPFCKGGTHAERSMSVGRSGAFLWWKCHRASCGKAGKHRVSGYGEEPETSDERRGRYREFERERIPPALEQELSERYSIRPETMDLARWSYTPDYDGHGPRVIMPIFKPNGSVRGENFRSYAGYEPKALVNMELAESGICWYKFRKYGKILVLTEDQPSALRVAQAHVDACALIGTTLNVERIAEIREQEYNRVWLSLDRDAMGQAVKYMKEYSPYLPALRIKELDGPDIKDMSAEEFDLYITEVLRV